MTRFASTPPYEHGLPESLGVLLVNLGTPAKATPSALRRYLNEFLSDPRVVELPGWLRWLLLHGIILRVRPARSAAAYRKIWTDQGSPLLLNCQDVATALGDRLQHRLAGSVNVVLGMSYGEPSIPAALDQLHAQFARRILVLPMYPQYANSTTGSVFAAVTSALSQRRWVPELRFVNHYHDANGFVSALAASIRDHWDRHGRGERLLFSFHGIPERMLRAGDPYHCQCQKTARLVAAALELEDGAWHVSFQSRLGRQQWLRPYTDETLEAWGRNGVGDIDVLCPAFSVDCLETLEEIAIAGAERYRAAGGGALRYVPCLNAREEHVAFLARLIEKHVAGWPEASADWSASDTAAELERSRRRACAMGADT